LALTDDDIREILRIIDESGLDELRIESDGLLLHVRRGAAPADAQPPEPARVEKPATPTEEPTAEAPAANGATIEAPMLGTFYRAEGPGQPVLVDVGDRVEPGTVVCLIEVMKLMNHIQSEVSGTVAEILTENGALVEFGQPLFRVDPDA
jgi:acetyl-CoA carboxylase biotin carboxyl carrier protein